MGPVHKIRLCHVLRAHNGPPAGSKNGKIDKFQDSTRSNIKPKGPQTISRAGKKQDEAQVKGYSPG